VANIDDDVVVVRENVPERLLEDVLAAGQP